MRLSPVCSVCTDGDHAAYCLFGERPTRGQFRRRPKKPYASPAVARTLPRFARRHSTVALPAKSRLAKSQVDPALSRSRRKLGEPAVSLEVCK